jgi:hypothetical protein
MEKILDNFNNWNNFSPVRSSIPLTWTNEDLKFNWNENVQTDEVPTDDPWITAPYRYYMEEMYQKWGVDHTCTKHYLTFSPNLNTNLSPILTHFNYKVMSYNLLLLPPGRNLLWHFDVYATFIKRNNLSLDDFDKIGRTVIMMKDWAYGQIIQIGNDVISHWKAGDTISWPSSTWHGASNFGGEDLIVMQVSYINE